MSEPTTDEHTPTRAADYTVLARALVAADAGAARAVLARLADDPAFVETVRRHHLIPLLWATLPPGDLAAELPPEVVEACEEWRRRPRPSAAENLQIASEVREALARVGIDCMLLKGAYFGHRLYGAIERRPQFDVDLLVRRRDVTAASHALGALGFAERWRDLHSISWMRGSAHVDLHSCFRNAPVYRQDEARIWRDRVSYVVDGVVFTTPSDEDTLVLLALSLFQDLGLGAAKLKQLLDVHLLAAAIDHAFDWDAFFARCGADGTLAIVVNVLDVVLRVFDAAAALPGLAAALAAHRARIVVSTRARALDLAFAPRGELASKAWFFAVYPGSLTWYWLWLLPRKVPMYFRGKAPTRAPSSMRPSLDTLRMVLGTRTSGFGRERRV